LWQRRREMDRGQRNKDRKTGVDEAIGYKGERERDRQTVMEIRRDRKSHTVKAQGRHRARVTYRHGNWNRVRL
jgi:hypothetical protein